MSTFMVFLIIMFVLMVSNDWSRAYRSRNNQIDECVERLEKKLDELMMKLNSMK